MRRILRVIRITFLVSSFRNDMRFPCRGTRARCFLRRGPLLPNMMCPTCQSRGASHRGPYFLYFFSLIREPQRSGDVLGASRISPTSEKLTQIEQKGDLKQLRITTHMPFLWRWEHQGKIGFLDWISSHATSSPVGSLLIQGRILNAKFTTALVPCLEQF